MAEKKANKTATRKPTTSRGFTADERAAMKERAKELKAAKNKEEAEQDVLAKIAELPEPDRGMAQRIHDIVKASAPSLLARTWYGMPAYAKDGKLICFFKPASKFQTRYATFGFEEAANLDDGPMWSTSWALTKLTPAEEKKLAALVRKAAG